MDKIISFKCQTVKARITILALTVLVTGSWLTGCDQTFKSSKSPRELIIAHTNDIEGALKPCSCLSDPAGGASRRATAMKTLRSSNETVLLLDGGDALYGTLASDNTQGLSQVAVMNALNYDAAVLGDRDFIFGLDQLMAAVKSADFPFLSANILRKDNKQSLVKSSTIINKGNQKIAIIGLTTMNVEKLISSDENLKLYIEVGDPIAIAQVLVPELKNKSDLVIVISHLGRDKDKELAQKVRGISLIIGAHNREVIAPAEILANSVPLVQVGFQGDILGVERISYSVQSSSVIIQNENITLNSSIESDAQMSAIVAHYEALAAWNGNSSFADVIGATYPLDVAKASPEIKTAYGIVTAFPDFIFQNIKPLDSKNPNITLQTCFINNLTKNYQINYSLIGIQNKYCLSGLKRVIPLLPKLLSAKKIDPHYWSED